MTKDDFIEIALFSLPDYSNKEELDRVKLDLAWRYDNGWSTYNAVEFIMMLEGFGEYSTMPEDECTELMNYLTKKYERNSQ
jgi:hypothetical protein